MSAPFFTPGPWRLHDGYLEGPSGDTLIHNIEPSWVPGAWTNNDLATANARLIAAAPELYEALEAALSKLGTPNGYFGSIGEPITRQMQRALAKATGE